MGIDIDSLLAAAASDLQQSLDSAQPDTPAQPEVAPTAAPLPDMGLDIDSLLAAANDTAQPAAVEPQPAPEAADPFAAATSESWLSDFISLITFALSICGKTDSLSPILVPGNNSPHTNFAGSIAAG